MIIKLLLHQVIGALIAHIGTGASVEVDTAMTVLLTLASEHAPLLQPFSVMLTGILDYIGNLHFTHIRQLFRTTTMLNVRQEQHNSIFVVDDDTHILIRKMVCCMPSLCCNFSRPFKICLGC